MAAPKGAGMTDHECARLVLRLFSAAGRVPGEVDFDVWGKALGGLEYREVEPVVDALALLPDLRPTPGGVLRELAAVRERRGRRHSLPPAAAPQLPDPVVRGHLADARDRLARARWHREDA